MEKHLRVFLLLLFLILCIRLFIFYSTKPVYKDGESVSFETQIYSAPKFSQNSQSFSVQTSTGDTIFINTTAAPEYSYGDRIFVSGNLKIKLLNGKTQFLSLKSPKIAPVKTSSNDFLAVVNVVRQKLINVFKQNLPDNSSGLLLGVVFGIKQNLSSNFLSNIKSVGVMHVIAASGMNVTMVGGFIFYLFSVFFKRQFSIIASILAILFYAFLAGLGASIIRASIMGIIAFSSQILGKQQYSGYALCLTGFFMLFIWPNFLFDIGFQLSFAATLGILYIPKLLFNKQNFISGDFLTTFAAQIATLPILLSNFGTYSLWSVVVNALVLWTVPVLMVLGGVAAIISFVSEPLARILLFLCLPLLVYFEKIVNIFANLKGNLEITNFPWQFSVSYYLFIIAVLFFFFKKREKGF